MFNPNHPSAQLRDNITRFLLQGEASGQFEAQLTRDIQARDERTRLTMADNHAKLLAATAAKEKRDADAAEAAKSERFAVDTKAGRDAVLEQIRISLNRPPNKEPKRFEAEYTHPQLLDLKFEFGVSGDELDTMQESVLADMAATLADVRNFKLYSLDDADASVNWYYDPLASASPSVVDPMQQLLNLNGVAEQTVFYSVDAPAAEEKTEFAFADILLEDTAHLDERYLGVILEDVHQNIFMLQSYRDERVNRRSIGWFAWGEEAPSFPVFPARIISVPLV